MTGYRMQSRRWALVLLAAGLGAGCGSNGGGKGGDARPADGGSTPGRDGPAGIDVAPVDAGETEAGGDQAPAAARLDETRILDDRICDVAWLKGRWIAAIHRDTVEPNLVTLHAFDLDGRPQESVALASDLAVSAVALAADSERLAVAWLKEDDAGYVVSLALATDLGVPPQPQEIARVPRAGTVTHGPHVAIASNGSGFAVLHGGKSGSELVLLDRTGQVTGRVPGSPSLYPGLFGRLVAGTDGGFALIESCPTLACLKVRTIAADGRDGSGYEIALGAEFTGAGNPIGAGLAYDHARRETAGALAGARVLLFDGAGQTTMLASTPPMQHRGRAIDVALVGQDEGPSALHVVWTEGSQTFHRDGGGQVRASEPRSTLRSNGPPNLARLAPAPTAVGLFSSRETACDACDPPPATTWFVRLGR